MAASPTKLVDQYGNRFCSSPMIKASRTSPDYTTSPRLSADVEQNIGFQSRQNLRDASHDIFANSPELQWAIVMKAEMCVGSGPDAFAPEFYGTDVEFGKKGVELLREWHKVFSPRGNPWDWAMVLKNISIALDLDGDVFRKFISDGYPMIQIIPAARIGGSFSFGEETVKDGMFAGMAYRDGVILDNALRTMGVCIFDSTGKEQERISCVNTFDADGNPQLTADGVLEYEPVYSGQARGIPPVGAASIDWKDLAQVRKFTKLALKKEASYSVIEHNEAGQEQDPKAENFVNPTGEENGTIYQEGADGVIKQIYRSGTNSKIEFPQGSNRPSTDQREFWNGILRRAFLAVKWPMELYDTLQKGGASLRLVMELAQYSFEARQTILQRIANQIDSWRIAKAIKSGELPMPSDPNDWRKWKHQEPEEMTADKGYSADIQRKDFLLGLTSMQRVRAAGGLNDLQIEQEIDAHTLRKFTSAKKIADQFNVPIDVVLAHREQRTQNMPTIQPEQTEEQNAD